MNEVLEINCEKLKESLCVFVVKDMFDFWIVLASVAVKNKLASDANADGTNLYPWPHGCEHGVVRLCRVQFKRGYCYPRDSVQLWALANEEADRVRKFLGIAKEANFADSI